MKVLVKSLLVLILVFGLPLFAFISWHRVLKFYATAPSREFYGILEDSNQVELDLRSLKSADWDELVHWSPYTSICDYGIAGYDSKDPDCDKSKDDGESYLVLIKKNQEVAIIPVQTSLAIFHPKLGRVKKEKAVFVFMDQGKFPNVELKNGPIDFALLDNRIFIDVFINDFGPYKFMFDTGGNNSMTFELASKLNLPVLDFGEAHGAGSESQRMGKTVVSKMQFGDVTLKQQEFLVMDYSKIQNAFNFKSLDGVFGYEVLQKYLTFIDYENSKISFYADEKDFEKTDFASMPFDLVFEKPFIKTSIQNLTANTLIDTGDRSALTITKRFLKNETIAKALSKKPIVTSGFGIGGPIPAKVSSIKILKIGPFVFKDVAARAPTAPGGFNAVDNLDASMGNEILKQFNIGLDYRNKNIYLKQNKSFGSPTQFTPVPNIKD